jgi:hypothetical protein
MQLNCLNQTVVNFFKVCALAAYTCLLGCSLLVNVCPELLTVHVLLLSLQLGHWLFLLHQIYILN